MSTAEKIYNIADNHARTVQVCIDRLHELGANEQLKALTGKLRKLAVRATAEDEGTYNSAISEIWLLEPISRSGPYEECMGAKKHLVLGLPALSHCPVKGSNTYRIG
jgi:hypothetical protein